MQLLLDKGRGFYKLVFSEVGSAMMIGGNILHHTRSITTAIALETSKGEFSQAIALGIVLVVLALTLNFSIIFFNKKTNL
jgi:tungstate transport system permease protein